MRNFFLVTLACVCFTQVILSLIGCKEQNNAQPVNATVESITSTIDGENFAITDSAVASIPNQAPNKGEEKAKKFRDSIIAKKIEVSPLKTAITEEKKLDCEYVFRFYELEVNESIKNKKISDKLKETVNDPILNACLKDKTYQEKFDKLMEKLDEAFLN